MSSLRQKLFVGVGVPSLLVALAGVWLSWHRANAAIHGATQREAVTLAEMIAGNFNLTTPGRDPSEAHRAVRDAIHSDSLLLRDVDGLRIIGRDGRVVWSRHVEDEGSAAPAKDAAWRGAGVVRQLGGMECATCHADHAMNMGTLELSMGTPTLRREASGVFQLSLFTLMALGAVLALATALSLHFMLTRPLLRLVGLMRRAEEGDFLVRAPVSGSDELAQLSVAFNRMLERLTSMKAQEIDTHRDLELAHEQLSLKKALEETNGRLQARLDALSLLYDVAKSLNSTLEPQELFKRISALITERMRIPRFSIMMVAATGKLEVTVSVPRGIEGMTFDIGEGACGRAAAMVKAIYIPDMTSDTEIFVARGPKRRGGSLLSIPMIHKERLLGVVNFERAEVAAFDSEEIELFTAVTDQAAMAVQNARLHHETVELSITDPLTGLPNRRHLFARLELEIARAQRFGANVSLLMVDIDHFKKLNDLAGHRAGDQTLREVAERMRLQVRKVDTLGRYGGEEFALVLPQISKVEAMEVAEKLRASVEQGPFTHGDSQPGGKVTISVGVATLPQDGESLERLVDCADAALYASKRGGRNKVSVFLPGMEDHPGRERGLSPQKRAKTGEHPLTKPA